VAQSKTNMIRQASEQEIQALHEQIDAWYAAVGDRHHGALAECAPPADETLPTLILPARIEVDPIASTVHVPVKLSETPSTTVYVELATVNGEGDMLAWEGGQYERLITTLSFPAGGPTEQSVTIRLRPDPANAGRAFGLFNTQAMNPGLQRAAEKTVITFVRGARRTRSIAFTAPQRAPKRGALTYSLGPIPFAASENGGRHVWRTRFVHGRVQDGNQELGYYTDPALHPGARPFEVRGGVLVLRAEKFPRARTFEVGGARRSFEYGASVLQAAWLSQLYGYYECEAMTSSARGTWSAFWLLPADGAWPPEIDVFEHPRNGEVTPGVTTVAMHWGTQADHKSIGATIKGFEELTAGFHTYGVDWRQDFTTWYLDGREIWRTPTRFHQPAFPLLDVAVGGWGGPPDFSRGTTEMQVRALRVYS